MQDVVVNVNPGICGFECVVKAEQTRKRVAAVTITQSDCTLIQKFSKLINNISLKDLFAPLTENVIFISAELAGCHNACPVPAAVVKACEVAFKVALPKNADICFIK